MTSPDFAGWAVVLSGFPSTVSSLDPSPPSTTSSVASWNCVNRYFKDSRFFALKTLFNLRAPKFCESYFFLVGNKDEMHWHWLCSNLTLMTSKQSQICLNQLKLNETNYLFYYLFDNFCRRLFQVGLRIESVEEHLYKVFRFRLEKDLHLVLHRNLQLVHRLLLLDQRDHVLRKSNRIGLATKSS